VLVAASTYVIEPSETEDRDLNHLLDRLDERHRLPAAA
jgi:hypothetical protein